MIGQEDFGHKQKRFQRHIADVLITATFRLKERFI